jgi:DNA-binding winged helix-turn-helix (wHTH) protein
MAGLKFPPFRLDLESGTLFKNEKAVAVRPKLWRVLCLLTARPAQLVTKEELLDSVWGETNVNEESVGQAIRELRLLLDDRGRVARFIETVHGRGYRFIANLQDASTASPAAVEAAKRLQSAAKVFVGRQHEKERLHAALQRARAGERQMVLVSGEPGIGKTWLIEEFLSEVAAAANGDAGVRVGRGQCIEHFGQVEAFLPLREALGRLCTRPGGEDLIAALRQLAPRWAAQIPGARLERSHEDDAWSASRTLLNLAAALESQRQPFVLVLEDLHWADHGTVDFLSLMARRSEAVPLLMVSSYRPVDAVLSGHPIRALATDLARRGLCAQIDLDFLTESDVRSYLDRRLPGHALEDEFVSRLHYHTNGAPLFVSDTIDALIDRGGLVREGGAWQLSPELRSGTLPVGASVAQVLREQAEHLTGEQRTVLDAASVVGVEFAAPAVAAAVGLSVGKVEEVCEPMARRRQLIEPAGLRRWADGREAAGYRFRHALNARVVLEGIPPTRRRSLQLKIAEGLERIRGENAGESAAELATRFEQCGETERAVSYWQRAASNAAGQFAYRVARDNLSRAIELNATLPADQRRDGVEAQLQLDLAAMATAIDGYAAEIAGKALARAVELTAQLGDWNLRMQAGLGSVTYRLNAGDARGSLQLARQVLSEIDGLDLPAPARALAHTALMVTSMYAGDLETAQEQAERIESLTPVEAVPVGSGRSASEFWVEPGVAFLSSRSIISVVSGRLEEGLQLALRGLERARSVAHPFNLSYALAHTGFVRFYREELAELEEIAKEMVDVSRHYELEFWLSHGLVLRGLARVRNGDPEGIADTEEAGTHWQAIGAVGGGSLFHALRAEAYLAGGRLESAAASVAEGLEIAERSGERLMDPELLRLRGELIRAGAFAENETTTDNKRDSKRLLERALNVARECHAALWELRAAITLCGQSKSHDSVEKALQHFRNESECPLLRRARERKGRERQLSES